MKKRSLRKFAADNAVGYLFLAPWLLGFLILTLYPMLQSLYYSFTSFDMLSEPTWIGLGNYVKMFTGDPTYLKSLSVTFTYVLLAVPLKLVFALVIAVIMNQKLRLIGLYRAVYYIPTLLGGSVAIAMLWRKLFSGDGVVNSILHALFGVTPPAWIASPDYALYTLVLLTVWQFGSSMIIFLAGLKQIPREYYEAASVDGAGKFTQFIRITIPALSPVILFNLIMQMISAFQAFTQSFIISAGKGGPLDSTMFYTLYLYIKGFYYFEMGYASAMAWVLLLILGILTMVIFRSSGSWVSYEGGD
ncbi:MAG: carbohydrate ABC transporter permease [Acetanaerobacterium sp.]